MSKWELIEQHKAMTLYGILDLMAWAIVIYKQQYNTQPG